MTPPTWLDATGPPRPTRAYGPMAASGADAHTAGHRRRRSTSRTGADCTTEYLPVSEGNGWWYLVPIWDPARQLRDASAG
jgi:hypothetical protein